eukprot:Hpha_TRINITY_DN32496_c0_g1::TRINITY_DN32496_c0_g1_i1::g.30823::m.30823
MGDEEKKELVEFMEEVKGSGGGTQGGTEPGKGSKPRRKGGAGRVFVDFPVDRQTWLEFPPVLFTSAQGSDWKEALDIFRSVVGDIQNEKRRLAGARTVCFALQRAGEWAAGLGFLAGLPALGVAQTEVIVGPIADATAKATAWAATCRLLSKHPNLVGVIKSHMFACADVRRWRQALLLSVPYRGDPGLCVAAVKVAGTMRAWRASLRATAECRTPSPRL